MKPPTKPYGRIRVEEEEAYLVEELLYEERNRVIADKILIRDAGGDPSPERTRLQLIRRLLDEVHRTMDDLGISKEVANGDAEEAYGD